MDTALITIMKEILYTVPTSKLDTFADAYSTLLENLGLDTLSDDFDKMYVEEHNRRSQE